MGIIGDLLVSVHQDIYNYNTRQYKKWKRERKRKQRAKEQANRSYHPQRNTTKKTPHSIVSPPRATSPIYNASIQTRPADPFLKYPTLKGKGEFVRSLSEKYVADYLFTHKVEYIYEKHIRLEDKEIKPDFYLPIYDLYVEFWGMLDKPNYFQTFKWKVDMYRKHHINFIALNPEDLPNLDERFGPKLQIAIRERK